MTEREIGAYRLLIDEAETARQYAALPPYAGNDVGARMFLDCMRRAPAESAAFLAELGIDPAKLFSARPLAEPDEKGEVLFLCAARLCGRLLSPEEHPRHSAEHAGMQLVFTADRRSFTQGLADFPEPQIEVRFVVSLPFDPDFFRRVFS